MGGNKGSSYLIENSNTPVHSIIASYNKDNYAHNAQQQLGYKFET